MARRISDALEMSANQTHSNILHSFLENLLIVIILVIAIIAISIKLAEQINIL